MKYVYRKIPLIRSGRIYTDKRTKDKFNGSIFGWGAYIQEGLYLGEKLLQLAIC